MKSNDNMDYEDQDRQFNLFTPKKEAAKMFHEPDMEVSSNDNEVQKIDADEAYRRTLLKNFRSIIRPELIEIIGKFKDNNKWQDKVSIMKLIALVLQDELCGIVDEYDEDIENQENQDGKSNRRPSNENIESTTKTLNINDYINASTVIQYL